MKGRVSGFLVVVAVGALVVLATSAGSLAGSRAASPFDEHWLKASAEGNLYEIAVGQLALENGSGGACSIGQMLVTDHTKALQQTRAIAKELGVTVPTKPSPIQQSILITLSKLSGLSFVQVFSNFGVGDHKTDLADAREAAAKAESAQIAKFARAMLPTLQKHLTAFAKLAKVTPEKLSPTSSDESGSCPGH